MIVDKNSIDDVRGCELEVDSFDNTVEMLTLLGLIPKTYEETYRET
jgi:hypothetical protein